MLAAAICSSVVLPAPFGPSTAQRSSSSTVQSIRSSSVLAPRRTVDLTNWSTASGLTCALAPSMRTRPAAGDAAAPRAGDVSRPARSPRVTVPVCAGRGRVGPGDVDRAARARARRAALLQRRAGADRRAVDRGDHRAGVDAGVGGRAAGEHRRRRAPVGVRRGDRRCRGSPGSPMWIELVSMPVSISSAIVGGVVDRDRVARRWSHAGGRGGGVHADDLAGRVVQRAAGVAGHDRRVDLDQPGELSRRSDRSVARGDRLVQRGHRAAGRARACRLPPALPTPTTASPTETPDESPTLAVCRPEALRSWSTATSSVGSVPTTSAR